MKVPWWMAWLLWLPRFIGWIVGQISGQK